MKRIPFGGLKPMGRLLAALALAKRQHVTMKRIPFGGLKRNFQHSICAVMGAGSDNEENPLRGIETFQEVNEPTGVVHHVTMKRIPFGGLKQNQDKLFHLPNLRDNEENPLRGIETTIHNISPGYEH